MESVLDELMALGNPQKMNEENFENLNSTNDDKNKRHDELLGVIKSTINMLHLQIEFMKEELREKNLLLKILNYRNANDGKLVDVQLTEDESQLKETYTASSDTNEFSSRNSPEGLVDYELTFDETLNNLHVNTNNRKSFEKQLDEYKSRQREFFCFQKSSSLSRTPQVHDNNTHLFSSTPMSYTPALEDEHKNPSEDYTEISDHTIDISISTTNERFPWVKHTSGVPSKIMAKMGYNGKGLGKTESGITEPISIKPTIFSHTDKKKNVKKNERRKTLLILSDSMLNQLQEKKLSKYVDVKIKCHGGCTVNCMYTHLESVLTLKPDFIILHVGTNDCANKTSDLVLKEIKALAEYIGMILPSAMIILSLPVVRTDSVKANTIATNFRKKAKGLMYTLLDNSAINETHLGRWGLHLNIQGVKKMAINIISFTKQL